MKAVFIWLAAVACFLAAGLFRGQGGVLIAAGVGLINLGLLVHVCRNK